MENILKYTPEGYLIITPSESGWQYAQQNENNFTLLEPDGSMIMVVGRLYQSAEASPLADQVRRIVACVNELAELSTEQIEDGVFRKMREDRDLLLQQRDELLADAERYRWLRSTQNTRSQESDYASGSYPIGTVDPIFVWVDDYSGEALMEECLDAAIDAAMEKERCHGG